MFILLFQLEQYHSHHYNQSGSLTDLLSPIQPFDMPTSRAGMVISNYGAYTMAPVKKRTGGRRPKEEEEHVSVLPSFFSKGTRNPKIKFVSSQMKAHYYNIVVE